MPAVPSAQQLHGGLQALAGAGVLILGDVMLDAYLTGDAERISPEAPVPVVRIEGETHLVGGAGNVARNITALGGKAALVGLRGRDAAGEALEQRLQDDGICFALHTPENRPTTIKTRILARQQQVLRFDREDATPLTEQETGALLGLVRDLLPEYAAVVLSDYGKGVVSRPLMLGLRALLEADGRDIPLLVDPKPLNFSLYDEVTILTPNAKETSESVNMPVRSEQEIVAASRAIMDRLNCRHLLTTLGGRGMAVFTDRQTVHHIPTTGRQVFDVTGAGDTVIATLALGFAAGLPLLQSCLLANYAAGIVVGKVGAATANPGQIAEAIDTLPLPELALWA